MSLRNSSGNAHEVTTAPRFGPLENLPTRPPVPVNGGRFTDINGDGKQDFVAMGPQLWGYYTRTDVRRLGKFPHLQHLSKYQSERS